MNRIFGVTLPDSFSTSNRKLVFRQAFYKIRRGLIRGALFKMCNWPRVDGMCFIGRGTEILYPELLQIGKLLSLGRFCSVNCLSTGGIRIGNRVTLGDFAWIQGTSHLANLGESLIIENNVYIGPHAVIGFHGKVVIREKTAIGANFQLSASSHDSDSIEDINRTVVQSIGISIGRCCWIGNDVKILDGVTVGNYAIIGAGSVVTRSIPDYSVAVGVPARIIRIRSNDTPTSQAEVG
ncbi:MAG: acyltransferase [Terrimicrobiaceae bacterium]|nr:acyltransferase [Terrimicrobiaceae bacterium]